MEPVALVVQVATGCSILCCRPSSVPVALAVMEVLVAMVWAATVVWVATAADRVGWLAKVATRDLGIQARVVPGVTGAWDRWAPHRAV